MNESLCVGGASLERRPLRLGETAGRPLARIVQSFLLHRRHHSAPTGRPPQTGHWPLTATSTSLVPGGQLARFASLDICRPDSNVAHKCCHQLPSGRPSGPLEPESTNRSASGRRASERASLPAAHLDGPSSAGSLHWPPSWGQPMQRFEVPLLWARKLRSLFSAPYLSSHLLTFVRLLRPFARHVVTQSASSNSRRRPFVPSGPSTSGPSADSPPGKQSCGRAPLASQYLPPIWPSSHLKICNSRPPDSCHLPSNWGQSLASIWPQLGSKFLLFGNPFQRKDSLSKEKTVYPKERLSLSASKQTPTSKGNPPQISNQPDQRTETSGSGPRCRRRLCMQSSGRPIVCETPSGLAASDLWPQMATRKLAR